MYNKVTLLGRLTQDPEIRHTNNGKAVASFTLATKRYSGNNDAVDFIPVVAWEKLAEIIGNNLSKGKRALVEGRIQIRSYEVDGQKRKVTEVVANNLYFVDSKGNDPEKPKNEFLSMGEVVEEEIPF